MKKIILAITMVASAAAANAQTALESNKFFDNWSLGVQGGVYEPTIRQNMLKDMRAGVNIELAKQVSPVFGVSANYFSGINASNFEGKEYAFPSHAVGAKTAVDFTTVGFNGLLNLSNLFGGYKGTPRPFEVVARAGLGWGFIMSHTNPQLKKSSDYYNTMTTTFGADFNFNLGKEKALTVNIKPAIVYWNTQTGLNVANSHIQLMAGITYHFKTSNGTRSFKSYDVGAMISEIELLNTNNNQLTNRVATLEDELAKKPKEIIKEVAKPVVTEKVIVKEAATQLAPVVIFGLGKSTIDASQRPSVAMIATYMKNHPTCKVAINGYASPEGNPELNQKLSTARAKAVYDMLIKTYGINADRLSYKGLGATDELFDENDWNRVATFIEESK